MMIRFVLLAACLLVLPHSQWVTAQEPKKDANKAVKLRWYGQSMFQLETPDGKLVVFDPHAMPIFAPPRLKADITLVSHPHTDHNLVAQLQEKGKVFEGVKVVKEKTKVGGVDVERQSQEWNKVDEKIGEGDAAIRIRTLGTYHDPLNGMQRGKNSVWIVDVAGLTICHLGDLGHDLTEEQVKAIGEVDVLMVPVGGIYTINGDAAQDVVKQIKPRLYVLPMHYGVPGFDDLQGPDEFLLGQKNVQKMFKTNELVIPVDMKADTPSIVLLGWRTPEKPDPEPKKNP